MAGIGGHDFQISGTSGKAVALVARVSSTTLEAALCTLALCTLALCTIALCTLALCTLTLCTLALCTLEAALCTLTLIIQAHDSSWKGLQ